MENFPFPEALEKETGRLTMYKAVFRLILRVLVLQVRVRRHSRRTFLV